LAVGLLGTGIVSGTPVAGDSKNTADVDADMTDHFPPQGNIQTDAGVYGINQTFKVGVVLSEAELKYKSFDWQLNWDGENGDGNPATPGILNYVAALPVNTPAGFSTSSPASGEGPLANVPFGEEAVWAGQFTTGAAVTVVGEYWQVELVCKTAGTAHIRLATLAESAFGTRTTEIPGQPHNMVLEPASPYAKVECKQLADIQTKKVETAGDPTVAGGMVAYKIDVLNAGPNDANGVLVGDMVPSDKTVVSFALTYTEKGGSPVSKTCSPGYARDFVHPKTSEILHNVVFCALATQGILVMHEGDSAQLNIVARASLLSAGKPNVNIGQAGSLGVGAPYNLPETEDPHGTKAEGGWEVTAANAYPFNIPGDSDCADVDAFLTYVGEPTLDPTLKNLGCEITAVAPAAVTITKDDNAGDGDYTTPEQITWEVTVAVGAGSPASGVKIRDDVNAATQDSIVSASILPAGICTNNPGLGGGAPKILHANASGASLADPDVLCILATDNDGDTLYDEDPAGDFDGDTDADDDGDCVGTPPTTPPGPCATSGGVDEDDAEVNIAAGSSVVMTVVTTVKVSETTSCLNNADVTFSDPKTVALTQPAAVICRPPDAELAKNPDMANIWLCVDQATDGLDNDGSTTADDQGEAATCLNAGEGSLNISELGRNINDLDSPNDDDDGDGQPVSQEWFDSLPPYLQTPELAAQIDHEGDEVGEGLGAYEFQLKFDHKIFDIYIEDSGWMGASGRTVICEMTIVTENDIRWACASIGAPGLPGRSGSGPVLIATIHVTPDPDLYRRLRPSKDNGVIRVLEDENCEFADTLGDPMGGTLPGGLLKTCGDSVLTVRMLEGDLDLDCEVGLTDEQMIAYRYGSFFGSLWYQPWFDLEPPLSDFDIDIKDIQFVFGRDGSTCANPYPDQDPAPFPPGY
jgi:uncharacterized repeat protein (TIGR01451 family)